MSRVWVPPKAVSAKVHSLVFSVVIRRDNVGDLQWGEGSLPWDRSTHPYAEVGGRRKDAKAYQCCMYRRDVSRLPAGITAHIIACLYFMVCCFYASYVMMRKCWEMAASDRPTFKELYSNISKYIERIAGYLDLGFNPFTSKKQVDDDEERGFDSPVTIQVIPASLGTDSSCQLDTQRWPKLHIKFHWPFLPCIVHWVTFFPFVHWCTDLMGVLLQ